MGTNAKFAFLFLSTVRVVFVDAASSQELAIPNDVHSITFILNQTTDVRNVSTAEQSVITESLNDQLMNKQKELVHGLFSILKEHKKKVIFGSVASMYATLLTSLLYSSYKVLRKDTWSSWKGHIPLDVLLLEFSQQDIAGELFMAIREKYPSDMQANFLSPLVAFTREIESEMQHLEGFVTLHEWIVRIKLSVLFPKQEKSVCLAQDKVRRLQYLKNLIMRWMSEYKIEESNNSSIVVYNGSK